MEYLTKWYEIIDQYKWNNYVNEMINSIQHNDYVNEIHNVIQWNDNANEMRNGYELMFEMQLNV